MIGTARSLVARATRINLIRMELNKLTLRKRAEMLANGLNMTTVLLARKPGIGPVNLAFSTKTLRSLCECQAKAEREIGISAAKQLRERLADFRAAENVLELVAGRPREMLGGRHRYYVVDLAHGYRMVLCPNHNEVPVLKTGGVNWLKVSRVKVHKIEVSHG